MSTVVCPDCQKQVEIISIKNSSCPICKYQSEVFTLEIRCHEIDISISEIKARGDDLVKRVNNLLKNGYLVQKESDTETKSIKQEIQKETNPLEKEKIELLSQIQIERDRIAEEKRINGILSGNISPITSQFSLQTGEKLYYSVQAQRMATFTEVTERTETNTDKGDALARGCGCGCLFGWIGALLGALSANSKTTSRVIKESRDSTRAVDKGMVLMTNRRILFNGENLVSVPYEDILLMDFEKGKDISMVMKYPNMLNKEYFNLYGDGATDCDYYYKGIIANLVSTSKKEDK
jgi:hypothetical protein